MYMIVGFDLKESELLHLKKAVRSEFDELTVGYAIATDDFTDFG
ncbi:hypothetical protein VCRA2110O1_60115 [Vibrio crassostreae]|nr:hypothetical protein VCRA2110O1_60115 [Vibrio crassostreae]